MRIMFYILTFFVIYNTVDNFLPQQYKDAQYQAGYDAGRWIRLNVLRN